VCENFNPNAPMAEKLMGRSPSGIFGYSPMLGGTQAGGRVRPSPVRRRGPDQDQERTAGRVRTFPVRHPPDGVHGRRHVRRLPRRRGPASLRNLCSAASPSRAGRM
jgi:hypothetical protein